MGILIVEKDNTSAELIYEIFIKDIKNLFFASDCMQAAIAFRKYNPSLVIIDLDISFTDSIDLINTMKIENKKLKVIGLYSSDVHNIKDNFMLHHIDALINKISINKDLHNTYISLIENNKN